MTLTWHPSNRIFLFVPRSFQPVPACSVMPSRSIMSKRRLTSARNASRRSLLPNNSHSTCSCTTTSESTSATTATRHSSSFLICSSTTVDTQVRSFYCLNSDSILHLNSDLICTARGECRSCKRALRCWTMSKPSHSCYKQHRPDYDLVLAFVTLLHDWLEYPGRVIVGFIQTGRRANRNIETSRLFPIQIFCILIFVRCWGMWGFVWK